MSETKRIGLVFGGRSVEHEVSLRSARTIDGALHEAGYEVVALGIAPDGGWIDPATGRAALEDGRRHLPASGGTPSATLHHLLQARPDVVFPTVHGTWGEDGCLQGLCEMLDLPYVGPGVTASAVAMDKLLCKRLLADRGIPVARDVAVTSKGWADHPEAVRTRVRDLTLPLYVKPAVGGSSVGVSRVADHGELDAAIEEALRFDHRLLVEEGIEGRELEVGVLGHARPEASEVGEIRPAKDFYDFADKYLDDRAELVAPAPLPDAVRARIRALALEAFAAIGASGLARVDFLLAGERLVLNEINTLPGFTAISMYPRLWRESGVPLPALVRRLVAAAGERHAERRKLDAGIEAWIGERLG